MFFLLKKNARPVAWFISLVLFFPFLPAQAQVIFLEDFENGMTFTTVDRDGFTPDPGVSYVTDAWVAIEDFDDTTNMVAVSTSWYDPFNTSDDWMITPLIHIDSNMALTWSAQAVDADFPDGYEVRISTTDSAIASFLVDPPLFSIAEEQPEWITRSVYLAAAGYANQDVYFAFRNISNNMYLLAVDDVIVRNPYPVDAKALSLEVPATACLLGNAETISITVENYGGTPLSNFDVTYIVNDGTTPVIVTETVSDTIQPGATYTYTFNQTADLSTLNLAYAISASVDATSDSDAANDSVNAPIVVNIMPHDASSPYITGFESFGEILGWKAADANDDGNTWFPAAIDPHSGNNHFIYQYNVDLITPADDWLFSTCFDLVADTQYRLSFFHKVGVAGGTVFPEKLKVAIGTSPGAASMTTVLEDLGAMNNDFYEEHNIVFDVPSTGVYYLGFHCYSDSNEFRLFLDDITLKIDTPTSVSLITEAAFSVFPNPTQGQLVVELNEQAAGKSTLIISDMVGKELLELPVANSRMTLDLTGNPEGVYFITLKAGDAQLKRKVVLSR